MLSLVNILRYNLKLAVSSFENCFITEKFQFSGNKLPNKAMIAHLRPSMHFVCELSEACPGYVHFQVLKGKYHEVKSQVWRELKLVRDFILVLVTCIFDEDPIKNGGAFVSTTFFSIIYVPENIFNTQEQVTPKLISDLVRI